MRRLPRTQTGRRRRPRRALVLAILVVLVVALLMSVAGAATAAEELNNTTSNPNVTTSAGLEAPELDYTFVWWTFILTFGLLVVYYILVLKISYKEFTKIIDAHFGPKREGR